MSCLCDCCMDELRDCPLLKKLIDRITYFISLDHQSPLQKYSYILRKLAIFERNMKEQRDEDYENMVRINSDELIRK